MAEPPNAGSYRHWDLGEIKLFVEAEVADQATAIEFLIPNVGQFVIRRA